MYPITNDRPCKRTEGIYVGNSAELKRAHQSVYDGFNGINFQPG